MKFGVCEILRARSFQPGSKQRVLVLLLDRSGSMLPFRRAPQRAANEFLEKERTADTADSTLVAVVTFADNMRIDVPLSLASDIKQLTGYAAGGMTCLHETLHQVLTALETECADARREGFNVDVFVGVITDGMNEPAVTDPPHILPELCVLAERAQTRGVNLLTMGIGVSGPDIAKPMGFPTDPDHALTLVRAADSLMQASLAFSQSGVRPARHHLQPASSPHR